MARRDMVSRAYLKMHEALLWSKLPIRDGDRAAEIGCAPGGAAQALLERGLHVLGVDPAEVHPRLIEHERFTHIRKRGSQVARRRFADVDWLFSDTNVAPNYALDTIEHIVTHRTSRVQGMLITLKLIDWGLAEQLGDYLDRVRSWGFSYVKARQLSLNRKELCLFALKRRHQRRAGPALRKRSVESGVPGAVRKATDEPVQPAGEHAAGEIEPS